MSYVARLIRDTRPQPPATLTDVGATAFVPDQGGLGAWVRRTFIDDDGALANERHAPLQDATIGWLWTNAIHQERNRVAAGMCRMVTPPQPKWSRAMADCQMLGWFGAIPDFLITISALHAVKMDDWAFCALIEHELCHAAQATDEFGSPRFTREGHPIFCLVGHDVEEFVDVVARYGADATGARDLVRMANAGPSVGAAQIAAACGTCAAMRRA